MKAASKVTPGWWIADGFFNKGGRALVGPFSSRDDALTARETIEPLAGRTDLHVDEYVAPAVDLPTRPTLGWLTSKYGGRVLGAWERYESSARSRVGEASALVRERDLPLEDVAAFREAVAVPKAALDELREVHDRCEATYPDYRDAVVDFLAATDAANGDPR